MKRNYLLAVVTTLALGLAACSETSSLTTYTMDEFSIAGPSTLSAGPIEITTTNDGEFPHTLVVTTADGEVLNATDLIPPGVSIDVLLELEPGTYQFTCRIVAQTDDGTLVDHFEAGMHQLVTVSG